MSKSFLGLVLACLFVLGVWAGGVGACPAAPGPDAAPSPRERVRIDRDWAFALGDAKDPAKDFGFGTAAFFFAKAGYGDGPASPGFDDRAWRRLDLPHDWAIEQPFDPRADTNHGSHAVGPAFPEHDIGWYRKRLNISEGDRGRRIAVEFDGVYRDASVWFNGFYIGEEHSGYSGFRYDLTDYVNWGGPNVLVVRVDASREEGWFYEGAGIYRHVWLTKTDPLHVAPWGTYVTSTVVGKDAVVRARATLDNEDSAPRAFSIDEEIIDPAGRSLARAEGPPRRLAPGASLEDAVDLTLPDAKLWSIETPVLDRLVTTVRSEGRIVDRYETPFGIRTVRWDAATGFWLNGRNLKLQGVSNHQDHAGVGVALPDALQTYRLSRLKAMGTNAYRTAHNPPTPELLDAADRLGVLILDEHRMMGTSPEIKDQLRRLVLRDRNHPSVVIWSVGNEEWALEGNELGARLTKLMQDDVHALDPTRRATVAISGGAGHGSSTTTDVMGFNYRAQHDVDGYHRAFPDTPVVMTEEGSTYATRGIYETDRDAVHIAAYDAPQSPRNGSSIEQGWTAVAERPWLAGMFTWTGFDYRGEPSPFGWPAISSQFGMLDTTGAFKDSAYYLKSWWTPSPMVHLLPHWTWPGREGQSIPVWVYSNADEVELFQDGASLGRKSMARNGHLEWQVTYRPGALVAKGYQAGREVAADRVETTGPATALRLEVDRATLAADGRDVAVVTVGAVDAHGRRVPTADAEATFSVAGPVHVIGVGNGDPGSHEADRVIDEVASRLVGGWALADLDGARMDGTAPPGAAWRDPFRWYPPGEGPRPPKAFLFAGRYVDPEGEAGAATTLFLPRLAADERVIVDGQDMTARLIRDDRGLSAPMGALAAVGAHTVTILAPADGEAALKALLQQGHDLASVQYRRPAPPWRRRLFSGSAQVLLQAGDVAGEAVLTATAPGLAPAHLVVRTDSAPPVAAATAR